MIYINRQFSEDHSYTYTSGKLVHFPHRVRLKESLQFVKKNILNKIIYIVDVGGGSGFLGDFISQRINSIKSQKVYDIVHPLNETNSKRKFFIPNLNTEYITFNLNIDNVNKLNINKNTLVICSETLEHIADPKNGVKKLIDVIETKDCDLYISYPVETGLKGINKFFLRLIFGVYFKKRSFSSLIKQFLWLIRLKRKFRIKSEMYTDHDGFDDSKLTSFIKKYSQKKQFDIFIFNGFSTTHIYLRSHI